MQPVPGSSLSLSHMIYITHRGRGQGTKMGQKSFKLLLPPWSGTHTSRSSGGSRETLLPLISGGNGDARLLQENFRILNFGLG